MWLLFTYIFLIFFLFFILFLRNIFYIQIILLYIQNSIKRILNLRRTRSFFFIFTNIICIYMSISIITNDIIVRIYIIISIISIINIIISIIIIFNITNTSIGITINLKGLWFIIFSFTCLLF
jgi:hypothetical protein